MVVVLAGCGFIKMLTEAIVRRFGLNQCIDFIWVILKFIILTGCPFTIKQTLVYGALGKSDSVITVEPSSANSSAEA